MTENTGEDAGIDAGIDALIARARHREEIILERPGGRDGLAGVLSVLMTAAAVWLLATGGLNGGGVWMGAASGLFFAAFGAYKLRLWRAVRLRQVRLTAEALEFPGVWDPQRAPWRTVDNIRAVPHASVLPGRGGGQMIVFNAETDRAGLHPHYGLSAEDMAELLETYRASALKNAPIL